MKISRKIEKNGGNKNNRKKEIRGNPEKNPGKIRRKSAKNLNIQKKSAEKSGNKNNQEKKSGENPEKNSAEFSFVKFAKITYSAAKRLKNGSKKCYYSSNLDRICLLQKTRCWRCRYLSSYIIHWMSSPKVASRQRSRLFQADFQLWHNWNFHEGNSAYIAKVFLTSETKLVKSQQSKYGLFQFDEFF